MRNYRNMVEDFVKDPSEASEYLRISMEEYETNGNLDAFLKAIRTVTDAQGGIAELAQKTNLNRQPHYQNPGFNIALFGT
ncbi:MAG: hypothetical protein KAR21_14555 [Spirochaetales bacterium]|nr:hypothetical protein [Spirochaetales bacterium]